MNLPLQISVLFPTLRRIAALFAAALLLAGCSAVRLGYSNAEGLLRWWIDRHVDFSEAQEIFVRERLARLHDWHRKTQLPDYAAFLRQAQSFVAGQPGLAEALELQEGVLQRGRTLAEQALPDIADFVLTLTPPQIARMAGRIDERNADFAKERKLGADAAEQRRAFYTLTLERAEYWLGSFDSAQKAALRRLTDAQPADATRFWYDERLRRQKDWLRLVRQTQSEKPPRERVVKQLREFVARFEAPIDPARQARAHELRQASAELTLAVLALTNATQRAHAQQKLAGLIADCEELARAP
jgi:hypothetical protein